MPTTKTRRSSLLVVSRNPRRGKVSVFGELVNHPKYGVQLKAESYQQEQPTSEQGLIAYLSGEKFPGIGKKTAEKIVDL